MMKTIITQLLASCAIETYVTNSASQEIPWQGSKYKTPPTSSVRQLRLCHYSGFPPPSTIPSHILPPSPTTPCSPRSAFPSGDFFPSMAHDSQQTGVQRIREPLSHCWVLMLRMRAGCCSQRQKRRKATFSIGDHEMGMPHTHSCLLRICETCVCSGPVASQEN